ncbi:MAG: hypothetical protein MPK62_00620 [Alphaproteobacteria bacterium]|nr:hypothetical protein [Alphaproteobacteria bacterium]MDA8029641.1 hypothetical protein [Alphaproteobacteria bacterium]
MSYDTFVYCPVHGYQVKGFSCPLERGETCNCGEPLYELEAPYRTGQPYETRDRGRLCGYGLSGYICMWHHRDDNTFCGADVCKEAGDDNYNGNPELCTEHYAVFRENAPACGEDPGDV